MYEAYGKGLPIKSLKNLLSPAVISCSSFPANLPYILCQFSPLFVLSLNNFKSFIYFFQFNVCFLIPWFIFMH